MSGGAAADAAVAAEAVNLWTNSRAVDRATAVARCRRIRAEAEAASTALGGPVQVVLRGDSTLRGHVFAETDVFITDYSPVQPGHRDAQQVLSQHPIDLWSRCLGWPSPARHRTRPGFSSPSRTRMRG